MNDAQRQLLAIGPRALHYFIAIADLGSFSRAAETLRISQPALSRQIKRLEAQLGVQLLQRHWRGIRLTPSGERLYDEAVAMERQFKRLSSDIGALAGELRGSVTLAVTPAAEHVIPDVVDRFIGLHPGVEIVIRQGYSETAQRLLEHGHADLGVFPCYSDADLANAGLVIEPILTEPECLVGQRDIDGSRAYRLAEVAQFPLVLPVRGNGLRTLVEAMAARQNLALRIVAEADGVGLIRALVARQIGCTILPMKTVEREVGAGLLRAAPICDPRIERTFVVAHHRKRGLSRAAGCMLPLLVEHVRAAVAAGWWINARLISASDGTPDRVRAPVAESSRRGSPNRRRRVVR